jgi:hypothetical protein
MNQQAIRHTTQTNQKKNQRKPEPQHRFMVREELLVRQEYPRGVTEEEHLSFLIRPRPVHVSGNKREKERGNDQAQARRDQKDQRERVAKHAQVPSTAMAEAITLQRKLNV